MQNQFYKQQQPKYAGGWVRLLASSVDFGIIFLIVYPINKLLGGYEAMSLSEYLITRTLFLFMYFLYTIMFESSKYQGILGKILFKLNVVDLELNRISLIRATIRYIFDYIPVLSLTILGYWFAGSQLATLKRIASDSNGLNVFHDMSEYGVLRRQVNLIDFILMVIWYLPMFFTIQKTGIHDILSKTRVIKNKIFPLKNLY